MPKTTMASTPLYRAAKLNGNAQVTKELIKAGADCQCQS